MGRTTNVGAGDSRRRDCHFTGTPCVSLLKHLLQVQGVPSNDSLADGYLLVHEEEPAGHDKDHRHDKNAALTLPSLARIGCRFATVKLSGTVAMIQLTW